MYGICVLEAKSSERMVEWVWIRRRSHCVADFMVLKWINAVKKIIEMWKFGVLLFTCTMCVIKIKSFQWALTWTNDKFFIRENILFCWITILIRKGSPIIYIIYLRVCSIFEMLQISSEYLEFVHFEVTKAWVPKKTFDDELKLLFHKTKLIGGIDKSQFFQLKFLKKSLEWQYFIIAF